MSNHNANTTTTALELQAGVLQLLAGPNASRQYIMTQVLEQAKKIHFWVGLIPDETYDPTVPLLSRPDTVALPLLPSLWTPSQLLHAEQLIQAYGVEHENENIPLQLLKAPIGPMYAYSSVNVKLNFVTG